MSKAKLSTAFSKVEISFLTRQLCSPTWRIDLKSVSCTLTPSGTIFSANSAAWNARHNKNKEQSQQASIHLCNFQNTHWFKPFMGDKYVKKFKTVRSNGTPSKAIPPFWMFKFTLQKACQCRVAIPQASKLAKTVASNGAPSKQPSSFRHVTSLDSHTLKKNLLNGNKLNTLLHNKGKQQDEKKTLAVHLEDMNLDKGFQATNACKQAVGLKGLNVYSPGSKKHEQPSWPKTLWYCTAGGCALQSVGLSPSAQLLGHLGHVQSQLKLLG